MKKAAQPVTIDMELLGAAFANMDSTEQGAFFRGLAKELSHWESDFRKQMQFSHVADELKESEKKELENALEMLWFTTYRGEEIVLGSQKCEIN